MFCILTTAKNRKNIIVSILREKFQSDEYEILLLSDVKKIVNSSKNVGKKEYEFVLFLSDVNDQSLKLYSLCMSDVMNTFKSKHVFTTMSYIQYENVIMYNEGVLDILDIIVRYFHFTKYTDDAKLISEYKKIRKNNKKAMYISFGEDDKFMNFAYLLHYINNFTDFLKESYTTHVFDLEDEYKKSTGSINVKSIIDTIIQENEQEEMILLKYYSNLICSRHDLEHDIIKKSRNNNLASGISTEIYFEVSNKRIYQILIGNKSKVMSLWSKIKEDTRHTITSYNILNTDNAASFSNAFQQHNIGFEYKILVNMNTVSNENTIINRRNVSQGGQSIIYYAEDTMSEERNVLLKQFRNKSHVLREYNIFTKFPAQSSIIPAPSVLDDETLVFKNIYSTDLRHLIDYYVYNSIYLPESYVNYIMNKLIHAMLHLYNHNIIHCDIKTENVCICGNMDDIGEPILIDFGNAIEYNKYKSAEGKVKGTLHYMAPELLTGISKNTIESDIWSLGILFLEIFVNELPWDNVRNLNVRKMAQILRSVDFMKIMKPHEHIPEIAKDVIMKMLQPDPRNRIKIHDLPQHPYFCDVNSSWKKNDLLVNYIKSLEEKNRNTLNRKASETV